MFYKHQIHWIVMGRIVTQLNNLLKQFFYSVYIDPLYKLFCTGFPPLSPLNSFSFPLPSSLPLLSEASLYLRVHADRDMPQDTTNIWQDMLIKYSPNLVMNPQTVAEVKEGLEFGRWMQLPSDLIFSTLHLVKLFASEGHVRSFSHLRWETCCVHKFIIRLSHANVWESMGKPCSCMQFTKSRIFYCKSRENPYQYYKSRELRLNVQWNWRFVW